MTLPRVRSAAAVLACAATVAACSTSGTRTPSPTGATTPEPATATTPTVAAPTSAPTTSSPATTGPASSASSSGIPAPAQPLRTVTATGPDGVTHVVRVWAERSDTTCYDHAHGTPVVTFLTTHPCTGLRRELATTTLDGRDVGISIIDTGFAGSAKDPYATTSAFRALVEKDGTGSIDDLLRAGYRLPSGPTSLPSPDAFACLGQDNGVTIYDLWFLDGPTPDNDKGLEQLAQDIYLQV